MSNVFKKVITIYDRMAKSHDTPSCTNYRHCKTCKCKEYKKIEGLKGSQPSDYLQKEKEKHGIESKQKQPEICKYAVETSSNSKCVRCNDILRQVTGLLDDIHEIKQNKTKVMCDHCKLSKIEKCLKCQELISSYITSKVTDYEKRQERYEEWLHKLKQLLLAILDSDETECIHKEHVYKSKNDELENLLQKLKKPLTKREVNITDFPEFEFKEALSPTSSITSSVAQHFVENNKIFEKLLTKLKYRNEEKKKEYERRASTMDTGMKAMTDEKAFESDVELTTSSSETKSPTLISALKTTTKVLPKKSPAQPVPMESGFALLPPQRDTKEKVVKKSKKVLLVSATQLHKREKMLAEERQKQFLKGSEQIEPMKRDMSKLEKKKMERDDKESEYELTDYEDTGRVKEFQEVFRYKPHHKEKKHAEKPEDTEMKDKLKYKGRKHKEKIIEIELSSDESVDGYMDKYFKNLKLKKSKPTVKAIKKSMKKSREKLVKKDAIEVENEKLTDKEIKDMEESEKKKKMKDGYELENIEKVKPGEKEEKELLLVERRSSTLVVGKSRLQKIAGMAKKSKTSITGKPSTEKLQEKFREPLREISSTEILKRGHKEKEISSQDEIAVEKSLIGIEKVQSKLLKETESKQSLHKEKPKEHEELESTSKLDEKVKKPKEFPGKKGKKSPLKSDKETEVDMDSPKKSGKIKLSKSMEELEKTEGKTKEKTKKKQKKGKSGEDGGEQSSTETEKKKQRPGRKLVSSPSAKLLSKLLKQKENERKLRQKEEEKRLKALKSIKIPFIPSLPVPKVNKHTQKRKKELDSGEGSKDDIFDVECKPEEKLEPEMIMGTEIVPLDSRYKIETESVVKPLLYQVQDLCITPPKPPSVASSTSLSTRRKSRAPKPDSNQWELNPDIAGVFRYALSNREYIDKGYTKLPSVKILRRMNIYKMEKFNTKNDWFRRHLHEKMLFYDTGEKVAEIDDDGFGRWYYRNGIVALKYYKAKEINVRERYVIYSSGEKDINGKDRPITVLASFDLIGNGVVFDHYGNVRLKYNQTEGVIMDDKIGPVSRWKWHALNDPPNLHTVYIDNYLRYEDRGACLQQLIKQQKAQVEDEVVDEVAVYDEMLSIEVGNFVKEKESKLLQRYEPFKIKVKAFKINEQFSLHILDQGHIYLLFRDGLLCFKLELGLFLLSNEIVDSESAELTQVMTSFDRLVPRSESVEELMRILDNTKRKFRTTTSVNKCPYT